ncbi:hypothetical protein MKZ38_009114 [Zalerion maritima]|uniref:Uncharacterized protein n=1 Tax=Zalerion maritima TaxID=339359 RepID=A0AAD5WUV9_9PEZI|nr:hypothetical protein MKZ38_009114 [Zalerion maritima]
MSENTNTGNLANNGATNPRRRNGTSLSSFGHPNPGEVLTTTIQINQPGDIDDNTTPALSSSTATRSSSSSGRPRKTQNYLQNAYETTENVHYGASPFDADEYKRWRNRRSPLRRRVIADFERCILGEVDEQTSRVSLRVRRNRITGYYNPLVRPAWLAAEGNENGQGIGADEEEEAPDLATDGIGGIEPEPPVNYSDNDNDYEQFVHLVALTLMYEYGDELGGFVGTAERDQWAE